MLWFIVPLLYVTYDASSQRYHRDQSAEQEFLHVDWWNSWWNTFCMSLMSTSGYGACWTLSAFLIPVTKHSPILDWLHVTPVQALSFHKVAGWYSLWYSVAHGYLHLRHLMGVLFRGVNARPWYERLWILLVPPSWRCVGNQNPLAAWTGQSHLDDHRCRLALVNATGMISVLAFVVLGITSHPRVRRYSYALFYRTHIPAAWIMLFNGIWHYPTCVVVMIPNIIYYLSFNIPVYVSQLMDSWSKKRGSPLLEANLIEGGTIELVVATDPKDRLRHDGRFLKLSHPSLSSVSHPFSVFSRQDLSDAAGDSGHDNLSTSVSVLFKPLGPFTKGLAKVLFPDHEYVYDETSQPETSDRHAEDDDDEADLEQSPTAPGHKSKNRKGKRKEYSLLSTHSMIQFDSFYASSFDWVDRAMLSHDEIMVVAGGVGIVPFLEFLPALQQRIHTDTIKAAATNNNEDGTDSESLNATSLTMFGPKRIHVHWYCREVGLASYVWYNHLRRHLQEVWESNPACQDRLKIHFHLTSLKEGDGLVAEEVLTNTPNAGLVEKLTYSTVAAVGQKPPGIVHPLKDARFTQSRCLGLLVPGSIMVTGIVAHWWWYDAIVANEEFRYDNLIMRTHSILFTLVAALVISVVVERCLRYSEDKNARKRALLDATTAAADVDVVVVMEDTTTKQKEESGVKSFPKVSKGRPAMDAVIRDILGAQRPGVYMCGPQALMKSVESSMGNQRRDCVFYREDSEM